MITIEKVKELIPEKVYLYYVDRSDDLSNNLKEVQEAISNQSIDNLNEVVDSAYYDDVFCLDELYSELKDDYIEKYPDEESEVDSFFDENEDDIKEIIRERDHSNILRDLMKNTTDLFMFYDTGYEMESESWNWSKLKIQKERQTIKEKLGIDSENTTWNNEIEMMIQQASYGGNLEIYFKGNIKDYLQIDKEFNSISFKDPTIGIIHHGNGSGDQCLLKGVTITLPLNHKNIFIEKTIKYNWSYDIAGMCHDAYDMTKVSFSKRDTDEQLPLSNNIAHMEREKLFDDAFKSGKCTPGDTDFSRHRQIVYINDYPCGNRCMDCGQFWID